MCVLINLNIFVFYFIKKLGQTYHNIAFRKISGNLLNTPYIRFDFIHFLFLYFW